MDQRINHPVYEGKIETIKKKKRKKIPKFMGYDKKYYKRKVYKVSMYIKKKTLKIKQLNFKKSKIRKKVSRIRKMVNIKVEMNKIRI